MHTEVTDLETLYPGLYRFWAGTDCFCLLCATMLALQQNKQRLRAGATLELHLGAVTTARAYTLRQSVSPDQ